MAEAEAATAVTGVVEEEVDGNGQSCVHETNLHAPNSQVYTHDMAKSTCLNRAGD